MSSDALEQGVQFHNEMQSLAGTEPITLEALERTLDALREGLQEVPKPFSLRKSRRVQSLLDMLYQDTFLPPVALLPLPEESEVERIRRSLAFHAFIMPAPLPAHLWLLTDPPYKATDPARRCGRIKLRRLPVYLQQELRRRKRRRNHA
jgi:hypothetical protein